MKTAFKFFHGGRLLAIAGHRETFRAQIARLRIDASRILWIQAAIVFDYAPVRSQPPLAVGPIFLSRLGRDADEDAGCQRTRDVRRKI
jgi:hypothetical protein